MSNNSNAASGGIGIFGLLGLIFITLKLCKVIDWSWWWVTAPFWAPILIILVIALIVLSLIGIAAVLKG